MGNTNIVDLFSGAGGESTGIIQALNGEPHDLAAVNHWDIAIETHKKNHPGARHFQADISHLNPHEVFDSRKKIDFLWASPECTHHSVARGGRPRSEQSRASAFLVLKWLSEFYVRRVYIENVPEFVSWGPLGSDGRPLKSKKGKTFNVFIDSLRALGYKVDWQILCAADYGDPTTRKRLYIQAVRGHEKIRWPDPTHARIPGLFGESPWVPASNVIDWSIPGKSIFNRKKPLAEATMKRIEIGIQRYWGEWAEPFIVHLRGTGTVKSVHNPIPTITSSGSHFGLVRPFMIIPRGQSHSRRIEDPCPTITATGAGHVGLIEPFFMSIDHQSSPNGVSSHKDPLPTVTSKNRFGIIEPFVIHYYGTNNSRRTDEPLGTVTSKERFGLVNGKSNLDITFRMLQPHELSAAQGFPRDYWFAGNKTDQVKQIGNAVPVGTARALATVGLGS